VRLLNLPREIQIAMSEGRVNESQARMLLAVPNIEMQAKLFDELLRKGTTVRELKDKIVTEKDPKHDYWEKRLEEKLGAPVKLVKQGTGGRMIVQFYSDEEWQSILDKLLGEEKF
jgi:ParB family chromosome partitioning protein